MCEKISLQIHILPAAYDRLEHMVAQLNATRGKGDPPWTLEECASWLVMAHSWGPDNTERPPVGPEKQLELGDIFW